MQQRLEVAAGIVVDEVRPSLGVEVEQGHAGNRIEVRIKRDPDVGALFHASDAVNLRHVRTRQAEFRARRRAGDRHVLIGDLAGFTSATAGGVRDSDAGATDRAGGWISTL